MGVGGGQEEGARLTLIDAVNICVTVVVYGAQASRATQMLTILDALLPRYLRHMRAETERVVAAAHAVASRACLAAPPGGEVAVRARLEILAIQKLACAIRTLVNTTDYLTRYVFIVCMARFFYHEQTCEMSILPFEY